MTAGRLLLLLKQFLDDPRYALSLQVGKWQWRSRIHNTTPIITTPEGTFDVHYLVSHSHVAELLWSVKSLFIHPRCQRYRLIVHDDGTLSLEDMQSITAHCKGVRIIHRNEADAALSHCLPPNSLALRNDLVLALKLYDFAHFSQGRPYLCVDTDVVFFREPTVLLDQLEKSQYFHYNQDPLGAKSTSHSIEKIHSATKTRPDRFNSGLLTVPPRSIRVEEIEEVLASLGPPDMLWALEQTVYAILATRHGCSPLPKDYGIRETEPSITSEHYYWKSRANLYRVAYPRLMRSTLAQLFQ